MAGRSDIKAGSAYVELLLKDSAFVKGLRNAGEKLKSFGAGMGVIGAAVGAAGAAITGPLLGALNHFSEFGSTLNDMSIRTGIAASTLAEFGYAADLSGSSLEGVEKSVRKMQKAIGAAIDGGQEAKDTFRELGIDLSALKQLSPDQQFELIGEKISAIPDPTKKAAAAMKVFGKSGTELLPMLEDLSTLRQEAKDLGIAPDDAAVKLADELGDSMDRAKRSIGAVVFQIGGALADGAIGVSNTIAAVAASVNRWIRANQKLIATVVGIGGVLVGAGAAIAAVGGAIWVVGAALSGLSAAFSVLGSTIAFVLSPVALVAGALIAGAAVWAIYTESGQAAVSGLMSVLNELLGVFNQMFGGIKDALTSGDLMLAGQIAMAGLNVAFQTGLSAINDVTGGAIDWLRSAWDVALSGITFAVTEWKLLTIIAFQSAAVAIVSFASDVAHFLTVSIPAYLAWFGEHWREVFTDIMNFTSTVATNIFTNLSNLWDGIKGLFNGEGFKFEWTPLTEGFESAMKELPQIAEREMGPIEQAMRDKLAGLSDELAGAWGKQQAGKPAATNQYTAKSNAQADLDALTAKANRTAEEKKLADANKKSAALGEVPDMAAKGKEVFSTFSAAGLAAAGAGGSHEDSAADETRRLRDEAKVAAKEQATRDAMMRVAIQSSFRIA